MEKSKKVQLFTYAGSLSVLLGLFLPFLRIPALGGLSLLGNMRAMGDLCGFMWVVSILGLGLLAYSLYITLVSKKCFMSGVYANIAYFVVLIVMFFVLKGRLAAEAGMFSDLVGAFIKIGFGVYMFLIAAVLYYMADKEAKRVTADIEV